MDRINAALSQQCQETNCQRERAEASVARLRRTLHAKQIKLADQDLRGGRLPQAVERLGGLRPDPGEEDLRGFEWYYLRGRSHPLRGVWRGHGSTVTAVAVAPDGRSVASAAWDGSVILWDRATGRLQHRLQGSRGHVCCVAFSPDGRTLAAAAWEPTGGSMSGELLLWELPVGRLYKRVPLWGQGAFGVAFANEGRTLAVALQDGFGLWDVATAAPRVFHCVDCSPEPHRRERRHPYAIAVAPDGTVALGCTDGTVRLCEPATGRERLRLAGHDGPVRAVAFHRDGRLLASGGYDGRVKLWTLPGGREHATLKHRYEVETLAFSPDGSVLAAAGGPLVGSRAIGELKLWSANGSALRAPSERGLAHVCGLAFTPDGRDLVLGCEDHTVRVLTTAAPPSRFSLKAHTPEEAWSLAFSPGGRTLVTSGDDGLVKLWDLTPGTRGRATLRATLCGHDSLVTAAAFTPDGRTVVSASYDREVWLWDAANVTPPVTLAAGPDRWRCLAISPDGKVLAVGSRDRGAVYLWDLRACRKLPWLDAGLKQVRVVAFAPDGQTLAAAGEGSQVLLWERTTWKRRVLLEDTDQIAALAFSRDGKTLATGNRAGIVRLSDVATGREVAALRGHAGAVNALAFSPDGRTLASAGEDRTVRLWQAATGEELLTLRGHETSVNALAFSPDGQTLASADHAGVVRLWRADSEEGAAPAR